MYGKIQVMFQSPPIRFPIKSHQTIIFLWFSYGFSYQKPDNRAPCAQILDARHHLGLHFHWGPRGGHPMPVTVNPGWFIGIPPDWIIRIPNIYIYIHMFMFICIIYGLYTRFNYYHPKIWRIRIIYYNIILGDSSISQITIIPKDMKGSIIPQLIINRHGV